MSELLFEQWRPPQLSVGQASQQLSLEEIQEKARQDGYSDGYAEGQAKGFAVGKEQLSHVNLQISELLSSLEKPFLRQGIEVSEYLLSLVSATCSKILRRDLRCDEDFIRGNLDKALEMLASSESVIRVTVHPDDKAVVEEYWDQEEARLVLYDDPEIMRGGCLVERGDSLVDATIENQLRQLLEQLSESEYSSNDQTTELTPLDIDKVADKAGQLDEPSDEI